MQRFRLRLRIAARRSALLSRSFHDVDLRYLQDTSIELLCSNAKAIDGLAALPCEDSVEPSGKRVRDNNAQEERHRQSWRQTAPSDRVGSKQQPSPEQRPD